MKFQLINIIICLLLFLSCTGNIKSKQVEKIKDETKLQTIAAFKSAEQIYENEWKLVFRKIDDCQYIIFYTDIERIKIQKDCLVIQNENKKIANQDLINLRFKIDYIEETIPDSVTGENIIINRLMQINQTQSDRFIEAGFKNDIEADGFILMLKEYVKKNSVEELSKHISYPLTAVFKNKRIKINNPEAFVKNYNIIFSKKIKNSIINQALADIKASSKGLRIGIGEVWINRINDKILITSIKNY